MMRKSLFVLVTTLFVGMLLVQPGVYASSKTSESQLAVLKGYYCLAGQLYPKFKITTSASGAIRVDERIKGYGWLTFWQRIPASADNYKAKLALPIPKGETHKFRIILSYNTTTVDTDYRSVKNSGQCE